MADFAALFNQTGFLPHGYCLSWSPQLLWSMVVGDAVIALSYYSIPLALLYFVHKRRDLQFHWMFLMFSAFIFACGTTHLIAILNIWRPVYWLDAGMKLATAFISLATAIFLWPLIPRVSRYLDERQRAEAELETANERLSESLALLRRRSRELDTLSYLGTLLQRSGNATELASMVARAAADLSLSSSGAVYLYEPGQPLLRAHAAWGDDEIKGSELSALQCHTLAGRSGVCPRPCRKPLNPLMEDTHLCVPLKDKAEIYGLLQFHGISKVEDPHQQALIQALAEHAAIALSNLRLREGLLDLSIRDPLTGLFNRRYLDSALQNEERRVRNTGGSVGIVIFDLDCFKNLNDAYGHDAGDVALKMFAQILMRNVRTGDIACRSGGEEFVLVLPGADCENTLRRAEHIRDMLARQTFQHRGAALGVVTVSAGVAALPESGSNASDVLRAADRALYQAKDAGRNRCVVAAAVVPAEALL